MLSPRGIGLFVLYQMNIFFCNFHLNSYIVVGFVLSQRVFSHRVIIYLS